MCGEIIGFLIIRQVKKPPLCGRALKEVGKTLHYISRFPPRFYQALPFPACSKAEQSTVKASLFVNKF